MKKRIATFLIVMVALATTALYANEPVPANKSVSQSIANLLKSEIEYPDFARVDDFECCVLLRVTINAEGTFDVDCTNCMNDRLEMYVKDEVDKIVTDRFTNYAGQTVSVKLVFKLID